MPKIGKPRSADRRGQMKVWKAFAACRALIVAYRRGGVYEHTDWNDVDDAYKIACEALNVRP